MAFLVEHAIALSYMDPERFMAIGPLLDQYLFQDKDGNVEADVVMRTLCEIHYKQEGLWGQREDGSWTDDPVNFATGKQSHLLALIQVVPLNLTTSRGHQPEQSQGRVISLKRTLATGSMQQTYSLCCSTASRKVTKPLWTRWFLLQPQ